MSFQPSEEQHKPPGTLQGTMPVYENNLNNRGRKISLYIEVVPAKTTAQKKAPIFILMGGPGQAATDLTSFFAQILKPLNQQSDLVLIDQRGTGKSNPL